MDQSPRAELEHLVEPATASSTAQQIHRLNSILKSLIEHSTYMLNILDDHETSDFTLKCGSRSFKVHKAILGARSAVFRAMFQSGMREAVDGEAVIEDIDEKTLEKILDYIYTGMHPYIDEDCDILALCKAADMYQLHSLMNFITGQLPLGAGELKPGDLADIFIAAEMINRKKMYEFAIDQLKKNKGILKDKQFEEKLKQFPEVLYKITVAISTNE